MSNRLDLYDKKILYYLDINSRVPASQISKKIKLPKETVNYRIKRLYKNGYVKGFYALINASLLGFYYYKVSFKLRNTTPTIEKKIVNYIKNNKRCFNLRQTEGPFDITFLLMQKNPAELKFFLKNFSIYFGEYLLQKSIHVIISTHKLNQKFTFSDEPHNKVFDHSKITEESLDSTDKKILANLSLNSRMSLIDLSKKVKRDHQVIGYRVKKLEKKGVIGSYNLFLDLTRFGKQFVAIDIMLKNPDVVTSMIEFFDKTKKCLIAYETVGRYDLSVELYVESDTALRKILEKFRTKFLKYYIQYDVSNIFEEFAINWSPFGSK